MFTSTWKQHEQSDAISNKTLILRIRHRRSNSEIFCSEINKLTESTRNEEQENCEMQSKFLINELNSEKF